MFSGQRLKEIREAQGMSQASVAKHLGISRSSYFNWENGKTKPNQKNLAALADILDVDITYFESEYNIVNNFLQLSPDNQVKAEEYVEELLLSQQASNIIPLFSVQVLSDIQLSAGIGEGFFDEFETEKDEFEDDDEGDLSLDSLGLR